MSLTPETANGVRVAIALHWGEYIREFGHQCPDYRMAYSQYEAHVTYHIMQKWESVTGLTLHDFFHQVKFVETLCRESYVEPAPLAAIDDYEPWWVE